jgi:two-component system nitrogen regulation sensor histidine kinase NtrY
MVFKRLDTKVILAGIFSSATGALFIWSLGKPFLRVTSAGLLLIWIFLVVILVHFLHRMRRDTDRFLSAFRAMDTSQTFPGRSADPFLRKLYDQFNEINANFRLVRIEKEREHQFFMHVLQHIGTGLLAFDETGAIRLCNRALHNMLGMQAIAALNDLAKADPGLPQLLEDLLPGEQCLIRIKVSQKIKHVSILTSSFRMEHIRITVASFRDITRDIEKTEMAAWQKLIRVVVHEITASVVPFRLLSSKLLGYLKPERAEKNRVILEDGDLEDVHSMLDIIHRRSEGLARFSESYKALEQVPAPDKSMLCILKLFREMELHFSGTLTGKSIKLLLSADPADLELYADEQLVIQMLINLINNAIHALDQMSDPIIKLTAYAENEQVILEVQDNGPGIPPEIQDSIFVPFFTTREGGSGIGLSLAKQIMNAHHGEIIPISGSGKGTIFQLLFREAPDS